ncbi:thiamine phosphate synthase [Desulfatiglans anilini]|uniref:thiamine phosphate synthase n=1 Tax=Desulfatiglans anilini TaxID=90728 RepID=UPI0004138A73|nr:thiamine phosphate synthase [Desulfatiglans anilini]
MQIKQIDYSLYLVTDRSLARGRPTRAIVEAAVRGGVTCVQLREKTCSTRTFIEEALGLRSLLHEHGIPLIINDRVDVALAVEADGVHLGQTDMPLPQARAILGDKALIGISAESLDDALRAEAEGADYIGVSPIFTTPTKTDTAPALGLGGLAAIRAAVRLPLVGIGGLNLENAAEVIRHGGSGLAVVSAIVSAEDPEAAARRLRAAIERAKAQWG